MVRGARAGGRPMTGRNLTRRRLLAAGTSAVSLAIAGSACTRALRPARRTEAFPPAAPSAVPSGRADGIRTGGARTVRVDSRYDVWVKQVGSGDVPVLTLHGGPGVPHFYLECFEDFLPQAGVRFWYYDQLGCGFSDQPTDPSLWTIDRFRDEVEQVRAALGLERFVLYGHSWGGLLGIEYALRYPQHLSGLVISNMVASASFYAAHVAKLRTALPAAARAVLDRYERARTYDAPDYQKVLFEEVYPRHICRLDPWPEPVTRAFRHLAMPVYETIQGPNEFMVTGTMRNWDRWQALPSITVPTLLLVGRHDEMAVADVRRMGELIPRSRVAVFDRGSHLTMWDDQDAYFAALVPFLRTAHAGLG